MDCAEDGIAWTKLHLKVRGFWTGPIVDVRDAPAILLSLEAQPEHLCHRPGFLLCTMWLSVLLLSVSRM